MDLCKYLRNKAMLGKWFRTQEELLATYALNDVPWTCNRTCQAWGPDDDLSAPERCQPGRSCFVRSKRAPPRDAVT